MMEYVITGLHGVSITLKLIVAFAGCRLVWYNFELYRRIGRQDLETISRMALWIAIPTVVTGALISRALNLYYYVEGEYFHDGFSTTAILVYLTMTIAGLLAALFYINVAAYGRKWLRWWSGVAMFAACTGVAVSFISFWHV